MLHIFQANDPHELAPLIRSEDWHAGEEVPDRHLAAWPDQQAITSPSNDSTVSSHSNVSFAEQGYL